MQLENRVFSTATFIEKVSPKFILVKIDYPDHSEQSDAEKKQNKDLAALFKIDVFPTLLLLDSSGRPYAKGTMEMDIGQHATQLLNLSKKRPIRDESLAAALKLEGLQKATAIHATLIAMELPHHYLTAFYKESIGLLIKNDPNDKTGFVKIGNTKKAYTELMAKIDKLYETDNYQGMVTAIDEYLENHQPRGPDKQIALADKFYFLEEQKKFAEALGVAEEIISIDPKSEIGQAAVVMKKDMAGQLKKSEK